MEEKLEVKITGHISGYYIVLINHIEIAHCRTWEEAISWWNISWPSTERQDPRSVRVIGRQEAKSAAESCSRNGYVTKHTI